MKIYVGNMPFSMNEGQLRTLFEGFGEVDSVNVITDRDTGRPRGFAFVEMNDDESAQKAIDDIARWIACGGSQNDFRWIFLPVNHTRNNRATTEVFKFKCCRDRPDA